MYTSKDAKNYDETRDMISLILNEMYDIHQGERRLCAFDDAFESVCLLLKELDKIFTHILKHQ